MLKGKIYLMAVSFCVFNFQINNIWAQDIPELGYVPGELLVRFAPTTRGEQLDTASKNVILSSLGGATIEQNIKIVPGLSLVKLPSDQTVIEALQTYNLVDGILYAEPNYKLEAFNTTPNDPCYVDLWGLNNTGQTGGTVDADIDAPEAWDIRKKADPNFIVAVIDSGVDYIHPDLEGNMWKNPVEKTGGANGDGKPGVAGVDDDGDGLIDEDSEGREPDDPGYTNDLVNDDDENGYKDDIYSYDFCQIYPKQRDSDPFDDSIDGHGTHIAGIIGATGNNDKYVSGVCWDVKLMAIKLFFDIVIST